MKGKKYYLAAFSAFFIWGFFSLALKPLSGYPSVTILFYRVFFSVFLMSFINIIFRRKVLLTNWNYFKILAPERKKSVFFLTLGGSCILASNWFIFIYVVNHVSVKAGSLAYLICPILTTVLAFFILKEKLSSWQWLAVSISAFSCILLSLHDFHDIFYSLVVAASYALYLVSQRKNHELDKFLVLNIQLLFIAAILLPFYPNYSGAIPTAGLFYICLSCIVVFFTIIPLFLNLYALKGINSSSVGILMYINPIINFSLAIFHFNEKVTLLQIGSYFLILISIIIFNKKLIFLDKTKIASPKIADSK
ncbi:EamA family transporter [Flavobacterium restrictum]|uniref:EamA family transporter n=1 Tax=Flavobacterium restrictum TaxID=2594428 RepID=A0A553E712_9FLAO|nr:EamA family transporter [Flavobacterium restrictum]TRX40810.1 EamA family transporter [Flavobacterium restrictum]